jgi:hypothetical protein
MSWSRIRAYFADSLGMQQQPPRAPRVTARIWVGTREVPIYETSRGYVAGTPTSGSRPHPTIRDAVAEARYGYVQGSRATTRSRSRSRSVSRLPLAKPERTFREQSFLFPMALYSQLDAARWCRAHNRRCDKVEAWGKHWRVRQIDPALCVPGTFRTVTYGKGISAVFCHVRARAALRRAA